MRRICAFFAILAPLFAQNAGDFSIGGTVVNSITGEPVRNARVTLTEVIDYQKLRSTGGAPALNRPITPTQKVTSTGEAGEFQFSGLETGTYHVEANKPGFLSVSQRTGDFVKPINLTESVTGVQVKLSPLGSIEGKAVDQFGEPIPRVLINVYQIVVNDGTRQLIHQRGVSTDDRGGYRVWNLIPGKYFVKAMGPNGSTFNYIGDSPPRYESWEGFAPAYAGGTHENESTTPIVIAEGSSVQADFSLPMEPAYRIRGVLQNYPQHENLVFELLQGNEPGRVARASVNGANGRFEIQDVVNGSYTLRATLQNKLRGETQVSIKGGNLTDVSISMSAPVTVKGTVHFLGDPPQQSTGGRAGSGNRVQPSMCIVRVHESGEQNMYQHQSRPGNGEFSIDNVFPGDYTAQIQCFSGYPVSATFGGQDLLASPKIVIQPGAPPSPIVIQLKPGGGTLKGKLTAENPPRTTGILLMPVSSPTASPFIIPAGFARGMMIDAPPNPFTGTGAPGEFDMPNLPPGDYTAYVLAHPNDVEYRNPDVLRSLGGGVSVHIDDGRTTEITFTGIPQ